MDAAGAGSRGELAAPSLAPHLACTPQVLLRDLDDERLEGQALVEQEVPQLPVEVGGEPRADQDGSLFCGL